jgi:putative NADH-flavin reductase
MLLTGYAAWRDISFEDYAIALADEIEKPARLRQHFTVGY